MGMLTELFVATKADARKYEQRLVQDEIDMDAAYPRASHKAITGIELSLLWAGMLKEPLSGKHFFKAVSSASDDGITEALPPQFVKMIAALPESDIEGVAAAWSGQPDIAISAAELAPIIRDLKVLAEKATSLKKDVYVWYCP